MGTLVHCFCMWVGTSITENNMNVPQNIKNKTSIWVSDFISGYIYKKELKSINWRDTCTSVFITHLFIMANIWKRPKCPSKDKWIKEMWYIRIV